MLLTDVGGEGSRTMSVQKAIRNLALLHCLSLLE
jgi:hypothetical protein